MIKYSLIAMIVFWSFISSCTQNKNSEKNEKTGDSTGLMLLDSSILENAKLSPLDYFIKKYADSVNDIKSLTIIPSFIANPQFDYENSGIWAPSHHPLPLRFMILEKVNNCNALNVLIQSNIQAYKVKPKKMYDIDVEYIQLSFYELASNRYKKLRCQP